MLLNARWTAAKHTLPSLPLLHSCTQSRSTSTIPTPDTTRLLHIARLALVSIYMYCSTHMTLLRHSQLHGWRPVLYFLSVALGTFMWEPLRPGLNCCQPRVTMELNVNRRLLQLQSINQSIRSCLEWPKWVTLTLRGPLNSATAYSTEKDCLNRWVFSCWWNDRKSTPMSRLQAWISSLRGGNRKCSAAVLSRSSIAWLAKTMVNKQWICETCWQLKWGKYL